MSSDNETSVTTPSSIIATLDLVKLRFISQLPILFIILGSIGFIGDTFTFLQPTLRRNPFCVYSLCGSISDIINLYINLLPNYIYNTDNIALIIVGTQSCKWKLFGLVAVPQLSLNFLILALIDRYSCTCSLTSPMRKLHALKQAPYLIGITITVSCLMSLYSPLLYDFVVGFGCVPTDLILDGVLYIVLHGLLTPLVMFIFVWLTYRNVKRSRQRVGAVTDASAQRSRHHFISLVFTQIVATAFFVLQWSVIYLYHLSTLNNQRSAEQWAIHYFVFSLSNTIYYLNNVKSFYLSTLTSRLFRETLTKSLLKLVGKRPEQLLVTVRPQTLANTVR